jgi:hypothetical protein
MKQTKKSKQQQKKTRNKKKKKSKYILHFIWSFEVVAYKTPKIKSVVQFYTPNLHKVEKGEGVVVLGEKWATNLEEIN